MCGCGGGGGGGKVNEGLVMVRLLMWAVIAVSRRSGSVSARSSGRSGSCSVRSSCRSCGL